MRRWRRGSGLAASLLALAVLAGGHAAHASLESGGAAVTDIDPAQVDLLAVPGAEPAGDPLAAPGYDAQRIKRPQTLAVVEEVPRADAPADPDAPTRSFGGFRASVLDAPWQVQIFQPWTRAQFAARGVGAADMPLWQLQHICGGALVASNWVVTAAHCLSGKDSTVGYKVGIGSRNIASGHGTAFTIDRVIRYNEASEPRAGPWRTDDIALVHFDGSIDTPDLDTIRSIGLDRGRAPADSTPVVVTGWGRLNNQVSTITPSAVLMRVELRTVDQQRCASGVWGQFVNHDRVICAAYPGRQTCQGDSGGPMVNRYGPPRLIGVVSWNNAACVGDPDRQGVYTRIACYAAWIDDTIRINKGRKPAAFLTSRVMARCPAAPPPASRS